MTMLLGALAKLLILAILVAGCVISCQQQLPERKQIYAAAALGAALLLYVSR